LPKELRGVSPLRMAMAWQHVDTVEEVKPWFLRDSPGFQLGITTFVIVGVATEIGAAERSLASLRFAGDTLFTTVASLRAGFTGASVSSPPREPPTY
jgi:hypothetical protein